MEVCFNGAEDANVVGSNGAAGVDPVRPIIVRANTSGILECNTECFGGFGRVEGDHGVAPGGVCVLIGKGCVDVVGLGLSWFVGWDVVGVRVFL